MKVKKAVSGGGPTQATTIRDTTATATTACCELG